MFARMAAFVVVVLVAPALTWAQALVDRVPADSMIYFGWRGVADLGPGYPQSHLKAVLDESDFRQFIDEFLPKVIERIGREDAQAKEVAQVVSAIAKPSWQRPTAFFFAGVAMPANQPPAPHLGMLWRAGPDADALAKQLEQLTGQLQPPFPVKVVKTPELVALMVGYDNPEGALGTAGKSLADDGDFKAAFGQVMKDPVAAAYVNYEKLLDMLNGVARQADPQAADVFGKVRESLGLNSLKRLAAASGFDGKDWGTTAFVEAPEPRTGLFKMMGGQPLSDAILTAIPKGSTIAGATRADLSSLLDTIRSTLRAVQPQMADQFDGVVNEVAKQSGVNVEKDLIASLGEEWAYFADPTMGGRGLAGLTLVNRLKDPARFEQSLAKMEDFVLKQIEEQMPAGDRPHLAFETVKIDNLTIHYLAVPLVAPCWTVHEGNLYVAAFPQVAAAAARRGAVAGSSIAQNPGFQALKARLGQTQMTGFSFRDLPQTAPDAYGAWLLISRVAGFGDLFGIKSPPIVLPELQKLQAHLSPAGSVSWVDAKGIHMRSVEPFAGSTVVASDPAVSAIYAEPVLVSILLPALNRAREQANRVKSANNLRQIGIASLKYASSHQGQFPPSLGVLMQQEELDPTVFLSPRSSNAPPAAPAGGRERIAWVDEHSDYAYAGAGKKASAPPDTVIAYEKPDAFAEGVNVLFADSHIEFMTTAEATARLRAGGGQ